MRDALIRAIAKALADGQYEVTRIPKGLRFEFKTPLTLSPFPVPINTLSVTADGDFISIKVDAKFIPTFLEPVIRIKIPK